MSGANILVNIVTAIGNIASGIKSAGNDPTGLIQEGVQHPATLALAGPLRGPLQDLYLAYQKGWQNINPQYRDALHNSIVVTSAIVGGIVLPNTVATFNKALSYGGSICGTNEHDTSVWPNNAYCGYLAISYPATLVSYLSIAVYYKLMYGHHKYYLCPARVKELADSLNINQDELLAAFKTVLKYLSSGKKSDNTNPQELIELLKSFKDDKPETFKQKYIAHFAKCTACENLNCHLTSALPSPDAPLVATAMAHQYKPKLLPFLPQNLLERQSGSYATIGQP